MFHLRGTNQSVYLYISIRSMLRIITYKLDCSVKNPLLKPYITFSFNRLPRSSYNIFLFLFYMLKKWLISLMFILQSVKGECGNDFLKPKIFESYYPISGNLSVYLYHSIYRTGVFMRNYFLRVTFLLFILLYKSWNSSFLFIFKSYESRGDELIPIFYPSK